METSCTHLQGSKQIIATKAPLLARNLPGERCGDVEAGAVSGGGDGELQDPSGKGKHCASFPASKIIPAPRFLHLTEQPEPKPRLPGAWEGWGTWLGSFFFFFKRKNLVLRLPHKTVPRVRDAARVMLRTFCTAKPTAQARQPP